MTAALEGGEWSASRPGRTLPPGERPSTHCTGGWVGPRAGLDGRKKNPSPPGFDPGTSNPLVSCYTDWVLLFCDRGTGKGRVVSSTPRPHFTPGERPGTHFTGGWVGPQDRSGRGGKSRRHRDSMPDRPARSKSLYRLSYPAHIQGL